MSPPPIEAQSLKKSLPKNLSQSLDTSLPYEGKSGSSSTATPRKIKITILHNEVPGRVRLEVPGLKENPALKQFLEVSLRRSPGIYWVSASVYTGNILIHFALEKNSQWVADQVGEQVLLSRDHLAQVLKFPKKSGRKLSPKSELQNPVSKAQSSGSTELNSWHQLSTEEVLAQLQTSWLGLSKEVVDKRLAHFGRNQMAESRSRTDLDIWIAQFKSPFAALLLGASGVALITGSPIEAAAILTVVVANAYIGYRTESMAEKTLSLLDEAKPAPVSVYRDGALESVSVENLVPGDLIEILPGATLPADARLVRVEHLSVDESVLTGECLPVSKTIHTMEVRDLPLGDRQNMVFRGTVVTSGRALAVVVATGPRTEIGKIQGLVNDTSHTLTPFQKQIAGLSRNLILMGAAMGATLLVVGLAQGYGGMEMFKLSLALAIAAIPEGLPAIATLAMSFGALRMRRRQVLIRSLDAVETLGATSVICLDKTGTLTLNQMEVVSVFAGMRELSYSKNQFFIGDVSEEISANTELQKLLQVCALCNETEVLENQGRSPVLKGSSTEKALMEMALASGLNINALRTQYPLLKTDYRTEDRVFMRTEHRSESDRCFVAVKGNPSQVLSLSRWHLKDGKKQLLSLKARRAIETHNHLMGDQALRVLGVAYLEGSFESPAESPNDTEPETPLESDLTPQPQLIWLGLVGMMDRERPGTSDTIRVFHDAGIETVMITGDQSATAEAIARSTGILEKNVYSRVSPADKLRIVRDFKSRGSVVAMVGDGVNDAPALKSSDVGIAMGKNGTHAAREVASVVIADDQLGGLIPAIEIGRGTHDSVKKSISFLLATNLSECLLMLGACLVGLGQPLGAMQILWINLVSDLLPALALAMEPPERSVMKRRPRDASEALIGRRDAKRIGVESALMMGCSLAAYQRGVSRYGAGPQAQSMAFLTLTSAQLFHTFTSRSSGNSRGNEKLASNKYVPMAVGAGFALQALPIAVPKVRRALGLGSLGGADLAICAGGALLSYLLNEGVRLEKQKRISRDTSVQTIQESESQVQEKASLESEPSVC